MAQLRQRYDSLPAKPNTYVFIVLFATPIAASALMAHFFWGTVWLAAAICALLTVPLFPRVEKTYALEDADPP